MNRIFKLTTLSAALLCITSGASATPVTLNASIADNTYLDSGSHAGSFDGSGLLPAHFQINSASYSFTFADDLDGFSSQSQQTGSTTTPTSYFLQSYDGFNYYYNTYRTTTNTAQVQRTGETEGVTVSLDGAAVGAGATAPSVSSQVDLEALGRSYDGRTGSNGSYYYYSCGNYTCSSYQPGFFYDNYTDYYSQTTTATLDYGGGFSVAGNVSDMLAINQLSDMRQLQFELYVNGDLNLVNATLNLDITELAADSPNAVPEPPAIMLGLAGWGAWRFSRRRRIPG